VSKYVCDVGCSFTYICEGGPSMFRFLSGFCLVESVGLGFLLFDREGVIVENVVDNV
jgi:hypothetical protein